MGSANNLLISDLESGTNAINAPRTGYWLSFGDGTNMQPPPDPTWASPFTPTASGYDGSLFYARFRSTGGKNVGMAFDLNYCGSKPHPYDVSAYTGISFAYMSSHAFKVMVTSVATTPTPTGTCTNLCSNHHGTELAAAASWTTVTIPFATLVQEFGTIAPLDKTKVLGLQFQVSGVFNSQTVMQDPITPAAVDFGLDEIAFTVP